MLQKNGSVTRVFRRGWYERHRWLRGSKRANRLYCWPCLIFADGAPDRYSSVRGGVSDLRNFRRSVKMHEKSKEHVRAAVNLNMLGKVRVDHLVDEGARLQMSRHNATVRRYRDLLKRLIDAW